MSAAEEFERGTDGPRVIVAPVDGSTTSLRAAAYAAGLARRQGAELVAVFVISGSAMVGLVPAVGPVLNEAERQVADELRDQFEEAAARAGVRARFIQVSGDPYAEIKRICEKVLADAVVVGASTSAGHRIVGSVGMRLVRAGKWPVTVVP